MEWLIIALGGGIGATLRYGIMQIIQKLHLNSYWATVTVNLIGSFFLGIAAHTTFFSGFISSFFTIGVLGAFTTFSTFAFDIVKLMEKNWNKTIIYVLLNLGGGLLLFAFGWMVI